MALSDLFSRRRKPDPDREVSAADAPAHPSKALARFLATLRAKTQPHLLDLGPVVGSNVTYFGEELGCKILVEDLAKDIDQHVRDQKTPELPAFLATRFPQQAGSFDGILCWDVFDFLEKAAAPALARQIVRMLKPGGTVMGFFCSLPAEQAAFTKYEIVDDTSLRHRQHNGSGGPRRVLQNRDIIRMFEGLSVSDSFLLKGSTREMILRRR